MGKKGLADDEQAVGQDTRDQPPGQPQVHPGRIEQEEQEEGVERHQQQSQVRDQGLHSHCPVRERRKLNKPREGSWLRTLCLSRLALGAHGAVAARECAAPPLA
jgi:hypothetical protein